MRDPNDVIQEVAKAQKIAFGKDSQLPTEYSVGFIGLGGIGKSALERLITLSPVNTGMNSYINRLVLYDVMIGKARGTRIALELNEDVPLPKIELIEPPVNPEEISIQKIKEKINGETPTHITFIAVDSPLNTTYVTWTKEHNLPPNRNIMTLNNAALIKKLAPVFDGYKGLVGIITNEPETLCTVFANTVNAKGEGMSTLRIFGHCHVDQLRNNYLIAKREIDIEKDIAGRKSEESREEPMKVTGAYIIGRHSDPWPVLTDLKINGLSKDYTPEQMLAKQQTLNSEIRKHAGSQVRVGVHTHEETASSIRDVTIAIMDEQKIVAVAAIRPHNEYNVFMTWPVRFENLQVQPVNIDLTAHDKEKLDERVREIVFMNRALTRSVPREELLKEVKGWIAQNKNIDEKELTTEAERITTAFLKQEKAMDSPYAGKISDFEPRPKRAPATITVRPGDTNKEYEALGLEGRLVTATAKAIRIFNLATFSEQPKFDFPGTQIMRTRGNRIFALGIQNKKQYLSLFDIETNTPHDALLLQENYFGLATTGDAVYLATRGANPSIIRFDLVRDGTLHFEETERITLPKNDYATLSVLKGEKREFYLGYGNGIDMLDEKGALLKVLPAQHRITSILALPGEIYGSNPSGSVIHWQGKKQDEFASNSGIFAVRGAMFCTLPNKQLLLRTGNDQLVFPHQYEQPTNIFLFNRGALVSDKNEVIYQPFEKNARLSSIAPNMITINSEVA